MSKIYYMMGKSSTGKDTLYKRVLSHEKLQLKTVIMYTTRPVRAGETNGVEYFFCDANKIEELSKAGKIIERRDYHTIHGLWTYFTADDGQIDLSQNDYFMIGTLESYLRTKEYFGGDVVVPIYIEVEDGERLSRALAREKMQSEPKYEEMCRRFLADAKDFSEDKLNAAGIKKRFINDKLEETEAEIVAYILKEGVSDGFKG